MITLSALGDEIDPDLDVQMDWVEKWGLRFIDVRAIDGLGIAKMTVPQARQYHQRLTGRESASATGLRPRCSTNATLHLRCEFAVLDKASADILHSVNDLIRSVNHGVWVVLRLDLNPY